METSNEPTIIETISKVTFSGNRFMQKFVNDGFVDQINKHKETLIGSDTWVQKTSIPDPSIGLFVAKTIGNDFYLVRLIVSNQTFVFEKINDQGDFELIPISDCNNIDGLVSIETFLNVIVHKESNNSSIPFEEALNNLQKFSTGDTSDIMVRLSDVFKLANGYHFYNKFPSVKQFSEISHGNSSSS